VTPLYKFLRPINWQLPSGSRSPLPIISYHTTMLAFRPSPAALRSFARVPARCYSSTISQFPPRHLLSIADLSPTELTTLVRNAQAHKKAIRGSTGEIPHSLRGALAGQTVAMIFNKLSTRTRISTEGAVATMGGNPMFLGKNDIQLGVWTVLSF
jgi:ornithine carbamoyltransferase